MARCQEFYKTIFQWEFAAPPAMKIPAGCYSIFSKPGTKLAGGVYLVKEEDMIQPKVNSEGRGQGAPRIAMVVEEVTGALKSIEAAGGKIVV
jgi:predicted enzyme related to lactoylglutathione lyase